MSDSRELSINDITLDIKDLPEFDLTDEILPYDGIIGQDDAVYQIETALETCGSEYNIYVCGDSGCGKKSKIIEIIKKKYKSKYSINDLCYIYNFNNSKEPKTLILNTGDAIKLKYDIKSIVKKCLEVIDDILLNSEYHIKRNNIINKYENEILNITDILYNEAENRKFKVKSNGDGFEFIPIIDDHEMTEREYTQLEKEERHEINNDVIKLKVIAIDVIKKISGIKDEMEKNSEDFFKECYLKQINIFLDNIIKYYLYNSEIENYIKNIVEDIFNNRNDFINNSSDKNKILKRYDANIMASNNKDMNSVVIYENSCDYNKLFGRIDYENEQVGLNTTDYMMIESGSVVKANGGVLILDAEELVKNYRSYDMIKKVVKNGKLSIQNNQGGLDILPISTIKPQEININIKIVLIGSYELYYYLYNYDSDFKELFKMKVELKDEIRNDEANTLKIIGFISNYCKNNSLHPVTRDGVVEILKYSLRKSGNKKYYSAKFNIISDILIRANNNSNKNNLNYINKLCIENAIKFIEMKGINIKDKINEMYRDNKYLIDLNGSRIGQINALSVMDFGDFMIGKLNKITAVTYVGRDGVINIEREVMMSGNIHSKGVMILTGYIGNIFGQDKQLSFNASLCFEQMYNEVDGDSASAAELIALLSSLGDIPLRQSIAITGSVNQFGFIQAVGEINKKIESFYYICKSCESTGEFGVIIPYYNMDELILNNEIENDILNKKFHIYAVKRIDECFPILFNNMIKQDNGDLFGVVKNRISSKLEKYGSIISQNNK